MSSHQNQNFDDFTKRILNHYRIHQFRFHLAAWLMVAFGFALAMMPDFSWPSILGFGISSLIASSLLCVLTYPVSGHFSFTIFGAIVGALMVPLLVLVGFIGASNGQAVQLCLLVGAIIGSSSTIWQAPMKFFGLIQNMTKSQPTV